jgi:hypothetical protein
MIQVASLVRQLKLTWVCEPHGYKDLEIHKQDLHNPRKLKINFNKRV